MDVRDVRMNDVEYRALLDLTMASDPSPLSDRLDRVLRGYLDRHAHALGYADWIEAYHYVPQGRCRHPMWWGSGMPAGHCGKPAWGDNYSHPKATNPTEWNAAHRRESPVWNPLPMACPRHGGPPDPRGEQEQSA